MSFSYNVVGGLVIEVKVSIIDDRRLWRSGLSIGKVFSNKVECGSLSSRVRILGIAVGTVELFKLAKLVS